MTLLEGLHCNHSVLSNCFSLDIQANTNTTNIFAVHYPGYVTGGHSLLRIAGLIPAHLHEGLGTVISVEVLSHSPGIHLHYGKM